MVVAQFVAVLKLVLHLVPLHGPDNQFIEINPQEIVSLREPRDTEQHLHPDVRCLVLTTDGKFVGVTETCQRVEELIEDRSDD